MMSKNDFKYHVLRNTFIKLYKIILNAIFLFGAGLKIMREETTKGTKRAKDRRRPSPNGARSRLQPCEVPQLLPLTNLDDGVGGGHQPGVVMLQPVVNARAMGQQIVSAYDDVLYPRPDQRGRILQ
jgi:hypothetical protein